MLASAVYVLKNRPTMPENIPSSEISTATLLSTDKWYPVLSAIQIFGREQSTFWIGEKPEEFLMPLDQTESQCYRVDFTPETRSADSSSIIGRIATMDPETRIQLLIIDNLAYVGNRTVMSAGYFSL